MLPHEGKSFFKPQSLTLIPQTNAKLTLDTNANLTKSQKHFYDRAESICKVEQRLFCCEDFTLSKSNFRQKILELKPYIEKVVDGRPSFYKIKGIDIVGDQHSITLRPTGVDTSQLEKILLNCKNSPPCIHDLRFKIESNLHEKLLLKGLSQHKQNHSIVLTDSILPSPNPNLNIKLVVYPKHFTIIIGCSLHPIIFDLQSLTNLWFVLGKYINQLESFVGSSFLIEPLSKWTHTHSHLNKDGSLELSGESFHCTQEDYNGVLYRIYSKSFSDGNRARVETIDTERKPLADMIKGVIEN